MKKLKSLCPIALLIVFSALLIFGTINTGHDWGGDFASYIMQAKALVEGTPSEFVESNRFAIEHTTRAFAPVAYPWGFPAMLAPVYAAFGQDIVALKSVCIGCFLLMLIFVSVAFRRNHRGVWLAALVGIMAFNPTLLLFLNRINSDIPFMFVSTVCVCLIGCFAARRRYIFSPVWDAIGLGLMIAFASSIRTNGILLLATLFLTQLIAYRWKTTNDRETPNASPSLPVQGLPYMIFFAVMFLLRLFLPGGEESHMEYLRLVTPGGIKYHVTYYGFLAKDFYEGTPYPFLVYLLSLPLAILGMARRYRKDYFIIIYLMMTYALYVLWPITQPVRFLFPIFPFYLSFVLTGLQALQGGAEQAHRRWRHALCILPVLIIFACLSVQSVSNARDNLGRNRAPLTGPNTPAAAQMLTFVRESTTPESIIVFFKPRVLRLLTDRQGYSATDPDELALADYLILVTERNKRQLQPDQVVMLQEQGLIENVFGNSGYTVYRLTEVIQP